MALCLRVGPYGQVRPWSMVVLKHMMMVGQGLHPHLRQMISLLEEVKAKLLQV